MSELRPARILPPGRLIRREIEARGWTQRQLAEIMGRPVQAITEIVRGTKQITPETARELAAAFGTSAEVWLNLETAYRLALAERTNADSIDAITRRARLHSLVPLGELIKRGWIEAGGTLDALERQVREFLGIESLDAVTPLAVSFRQATGREVDPGAQRAWLRRVEVLAGQQRAEPFSPAALRAGIPALLSHAASTAGVDAVPQAVRALGVAFLIVPPLERTFIDGAALWLDGRPVVALTLRYDRIDNFWMTLLHELAHITAGHEGVHIDASDQEDVANLGDAASPEERQAQALALNWLIDPAALEAFCQRAGPEFTLDAIKEFAATQRRSSGIVVGCLHGTGLLGYERQRILLGKVRSRLQPWMDTAEPRS